MYAKYPIDKKRAKPHLHPVVQLVGNKFLQAHKKKHEVSWSGLSTDAVWLLSSSKSSIILDGLQTSAQSPLTHKAENIRNGHPP